MVWSEQVGVSLVLPADRQPGDGRNYIIVGEDVPSEIASKFTAALVFYSGKPTDPSTSYGFNYWAIGISVDGYLEIVGLVYADVSSGQGIYQTYLQSVLSVQPPIGVDKSPTLRLGNGGEYNQKGVYLNQGATDFSGRITTTNTGTHGGELRIYKAKDINPASPALEGTNDTAPFAIDATNDSTGTVDRAIMDVNELASLHFDIANGWSVGPFFIWNPEAAGSTQATAAAALTRKDYVDSGGTRDTARTTLNTKLTWSTDWALSGTCWGRKTGSGTAILYVEFTYTGSTAITVPTNGNITNINVGNVPVGTFRPVDNTPASSTSTGPMASGYFGPDGAIMLTAVAPGTVLTSGTTFSLHAAGYSLA